MRMLLGALAFAASIVHVSAHAGQVQTLYTSPAHQRIQAFAQDGDLLAWFAPNARKCNAVWIWQLGSAKVTLPAQGSAYHNVTCRWQVPTGSPVGLALASNEGSPAALWTLRESASQALRFDYVLGATLADTNERRFQQVAHAKHGAGLWLGGVAGNDGSLVYSVVKVEYHDQVACLSTPKSAHACALEVTGGGVYRVVGRKPPTLLKGGGPAVQLAVSGEDVAYVPAAATAMADGRPLASADIPVEIRNVATGSVVASVTPSGTPIAVALSPDVLALLGRTDSGSVVLSWYDSATGKLLHSLAVKNTASPEIGVGTTAIVYRVGRAIKTVDMRTLTVRTLTTAAATPIGLSIAGDRIAWAEDVDGRGRIRAVTVTG